MFLTLNYSFSLTYIIVFHFFFFRHKVINTTKAKTSIIDLDDTNLGHKKANEDEVAEQEEKVRDVLFFRFLFKNKPERVFGL